MKKHILIIIILIISVFQLSAQKTKDVLYLKNGSIIYGKLMEIADEQYKIQTSDGSIFVFKSSEVEKFAKEAPDLNDRKKVGFGLSLEAGLLFGTKHTDFATPFSFNILASATNNGTNITSLGSGIEFYGRPYTPLFLEFKHIFFNKKTTPFIFVRGGGVIAFGGSDESTSPNNNNGTIPRNYKGGGSFALGTGILWAKEEYETYLSFAYRYLKTSYSQEEYNLGTVTYENKLNRLEIKFGYKF